MPFIAFLAQTTTSAPPSDGSGSRSTTELAIEYGFYLLVMILTVAGAYGREIIDLLSNRPRRAPSSRLGSLEFVERHPELVTLGHNEALLVARVLRDELDRRGRYDKRFQVALMVVSLVIGVGFGRVFGP